MLKVSCFLISLHEILTQSLNETYIYFNRSVQNQIEIDYLHREKVIDLSIRGYWFSSFSNNLNFIII